MDGATFYEEFKNALRALGLQWCDMSLVKVKIKGNSLVFRYSRRTYTAELG